MEVCTFLFLNWTQWNYNCIKGFLLWFTKQSLINVSTQGFLFQMKKEMNGLLQVETIWAHIIQLSTKGTNLILQALFSCWQLSYSWAAKVPTSPLKRKALSTVLPSFYWSKSYLHGLKFHHQEDASSLTSPSPCWSSIVCFLIWIGGISILLEVAYPQV